MLETSLQKNSYRKTSLHTIAPYVGKLRPDIVSTLIENYSDENSVVYDPFCGSGTVPLEAWIQERKTFAVDLNYYAYVLTNAKLHPYPTLDSAISALTKYNNVVEYNKNLVDLKCVPEWVTDFFHADTLKEVLVWFSLLKSESDYFLLSCLLGILHHQRPGFLSFPSSHGAPYLRKEKYPISDYPEMYEYRNVYTRLHKKVERVYKVVPQLNFSVDRKVLHMNTIDLNTSIAGSVTIITSPPYMNSLTYARDNRLRLWFLGHKDSGKLDKLLSLNNNSFACLMVKCFTIWSGLQKRGNYCILVVGDILFDKSKKQSLPDLICKQACSSNYDLVDIIDYPVNINRKVVKVDSEIKNEKICVFQRR